MKFTHKTAPKVEVTWEDSASVHGWGQDPGDEAHSTAECSTMGYLLNRDEDHVAVAQNRGPGRFGEVMVIPLSCVKRIRRQRDA